MSRVYCVTSLALLVVLFSAHSERAAAQFGGGRSGGEGGYGRGGYGGEFGGGYGEQPKRKSERKNRVTSTISKSKAEEKIEQALDEPLKSPLQCEDQPLNEVINTLQDEYDIPIIIDQQALEEIAISPVTEITINLRNIPLSSALNLIFRQPGLEDLTYDVVENVLLITTQEKANQRLSVEVYRVDDLISGYSQNPGGNQENPYSSLVQVITNSIEFDSWMANGHGEGEIHLMEPGMLIISHSKRVQDNVQALLQKLRQMKTEIKGE
ncbi:hypothetical protein [Bythopirellula polymerisocia]|uniref:Uncharacterized protein n=1 Tax=Bythopirellula polymerisocia TaxID=2528003 RepID=A0A5C6D2E6_9BACT|nr:hypothetical protein [Bythopirellula polymerisocia]TWU29386.1 hypothetical protein Pla144_01640 [Bythopirellula polymerisocia]